MIPIKENYIIDDKGKTTKVILSIKDYDRMIEYIEDLEDIAAYDKAKAKKNTKTTPWKSVRK